VEENGRRVPVSLARYGLQTGENLLHIPLREIRDDAGEWPAFAEVNEIQLVFEWADMRGELLLQSLQFRSIWQESIQPAARSQELAAMLQTPAGFTVEAIADGLRETTQLAFDSSGTLWVSLQNGRIWNYADMTGDGVYDERLLYATGFVEVVGLLPDPVDGAIWIGGRGQLYRTADRDGNGVADFRELRIDGLPWGRHQNNGLAWNPDPDPFTGESGAHWIYFGLGSTEDLEVGGDLNATVLRFPRDGAGQEDLEVVSRGNRNPYMVIWAPVPVDLAQPEGATAWQLFASENGPDFNEAPDEVNHIRWRHHYGFPEQFGPVAEDAIDGDPYSGPIYPVTAHASASGLAYVTNPAWPPAYRTLYVSLFGQVFSPEIVGHTVERVTLTPVESATGATYRGEPTTFVAGLDRPLPMTTAPDGNLVVGDYATGVIYKVRYVGE
jgi:glucose/arabinose dehydrogenase